MSGAPQVFVRVMREGARHPQHGGALPFMERVAMKVDDARTAVRAGDVAVDDGATFVGEGADYSAPGVTDPDALRAELRAIAAEIQAARVAELRASLEAAAPGFVDRLAAAAAPPLTADASAPTKEP